MSISSEFNYVVEVHRRDFAVFAGRVKGFLDLVFRLSLFVLRKLLVVLAHFVGLQELLDID
jgi:hypothetical protein